MKPRPPDKVCLLDSSPSAVALKMNHMVCDAAGFKAYLYFLCEIYWGITAGPAYKPTAIAVIGACAGCSERFGMGVKLKSLLAEQGE